jgi:choline-sulfatase
MRTLCALGLLACIVLAVSCGHEPERLNVIIIGMDAVRPDHLGCYGYERNTSPSIDRLAAEGVLCEDAVSPAPWTLPSFATVLTSLYPTQHGAVGFNHTLRTSFPTLAEILRARGYSTGALINGPALKPANGISRGFDFYDTSLLGERAADGTTTDLLAWIDQVGDPPFFMLAHYFDTHRPYSPPPPYHRMFDPDYSGPIGDSFDLESYAGSKTEAFEQMKALKPQDWNHIVSLYDGELAFMDREIGRLLDGLDERNLRRNTLIVLLSDHGEEFNDHGGLGHAHSLYGELIKVPLIFSLPGTLPQNARLGRQVRLLDVTPTILDILDQDVETHFEGVSLNPLLDGRGVAATQVSSLLPPGIAFAEAVAYGPEQKTIVSPPWKLIYTPSSGECQLFNLQDDPGEQRNLAGQDREHLLLLDEALLVTLFGLSETWYVELVGGGQKHRFDLQVKAERGLSIGRINPYATFDDGGHLVDVGEAVSLRASRAVLEVNDLEVGSALTLAFKIDPVRIPVKFSIQIDGRPTLGNTYLGEALNHPADMPFTVPAHRGLVKSTGRPPSTPAPPYVLIWLAQSPYTGETKVRLDEQTKRELRALGYIQ